MKEEDKIYYDSAPIDALEATYNIIYGQRGNGKTYKICRKIIDYYIDNAVPSALIRRLDEMIKPANIQDLFNPHLDYISERTSGKWTGIYYRSHQFFLARYKDGKMILKDDKPFCRAYAVNTAETTKGQDSGVVRYILFDEFITRSFYITNEFLLFQNLLSSIIRNRSGVTIYMIANTVSKYCPYFKEMGLDRVPKQKQGTIDLYTMGKTNTKIAVEYCSKSEVSEKVAEYYCFDNPELQMITTGSWEISLYRHIPKGLSAADPEFEFYVVFDGNILRGAIYIYEDSPLITFTSKTTPIKKYDEQLVYSDIINDPNPLHQTNLSYDGTAAHKLILSLLKQHKTYFGTNEDGENISNWLKWATKGGLKV